jgi:uncharacterized protein
MGKLLLLILLAIVGWLVFKALNRPSRQDRSDQPAGQSPEPMVKCAHCGIHLPQSEGLAKGERYYCCEEHRRLGGH